MSAKVRFLNPATLSKPPGYTHVVEATAPARLVYLAGQLGLDVNNNLVGAPGDFRAQCTQTFENLKAALAAIGGSLDDVVKLNNYLVDMSHLPIFREVRDSYLKPVNKPASTTIAISALARPGALIEIEAVAVLAAAASSRAARTKAARTRRTAKAARSSKQKAAGRRRK